MKFRCLFIIGFIIIFFTSVSFVFGLEQKDIENKIKEYENKLVELRSQKNTLASQIQYMDTQVYLTELQIEETEGKIEQTQKEIESLTTKIEGLDDSLSYLSKLLINQVVEGYKKRTVSFFALFLDSGNAQDLFNRLQYLKTTQNNNQKTLIQVQKTKFNFEDQKKLREEKKVELAELSKTLDQQKNSLAIQRNSKQKILADTQNDEKTYQRLLSDAQRELSQIQQAAIVLQDATPVQINKGDFIGIQGNTGYSFGNHLHFGVYNYSSIGQISSNNWYYNNWTDPSEVLSSRTVRWNTGCESSYDKFVGNGNFAWPMDLSEISQGSGHTCYSNSYYKGNPHPAWDMWGPIGTTVKASETGQAYFCRNCLNDGGNGVFIFHSNGKMTLYWHLQ